MKDCKDNKKCCRVCKHNGERKVNQKTCKRGYHAVLGFRCRDFETYPIGYQFTIFDILEGNIK